MHKNKIEKQVCFSLANQILPWSIIPGSEPGVKLRGLK